MRDAISGRRIVFELNGPGFRSFHGIFRARDRDRGPPFPAPLKPTPHYTIFAGNCKELLLVTYLRQRRLVPSSGALLAFVNHGLPLAPTGLPEESGTPYVQEFFTLLTTLFHP